MTPGLLDSPLYWEMCLVVGVSWIRTIRLGEKYKSTSALMEKEFCPINKQATKFKLQIISSVLKFETICILNQGEKSHTQYCNQNTSLLLPCAVYLLFTIVLECPNEMHYNNFPTKSHKSLTVIDVNISHAKPRMAWYNDKWLKSPFTAHFREWQIVFDAGNRYR